MPAIPTVLPLFLNVSIPRDYAFPSLSPSVHHLYLDFLLMLLPRCSPHLRSFSVAVQYNLVSLLGSEDLYALLVVDEITLAEIFDLLTHVGGTLTCKLGRRRKWFGMMWFARCGKGLASPTWQWCARHSALEDCELAAYRVQWNSYGDLSFIGFVKFVSVRQCRRVDTSQGERICLPWCCLGWTLLVRQRLAILTSIRSSS